MNTRTRHGLAATGAATILTALGAFATMQPASASPADPPGSPGTLSGNTVHVPASTEDWTPAHVTPISAAAFDAGSRDARCAGYGTVRYCEAFTNQVEDGVDWDVYIAVPQQTTVDATLNIDVPWMGGVQKYAVPVHAESSYAHVSWAAVSPTTESTFNTVSVITLDNGTSYAETGTPTLEDAGWYSENDLALNPA